MVSYDRARCKRFSKQCHAQRSLNRFGAHASHCPRARTPSPLLPIRAHVHAIPGHRSPSRFGALLKRHLPLLLLLLVVTGVSVWARWSLLPQSMALGDSLGPWLVAARGPWSTAPHAPPYGWMLAVPHRWILATTHDLYSAFAAIRFVDALVAPLGAWAAHRHTDNFWGALAVGLLLALDPSLIDTATSGAEAYQAPVAIAAVALLVTPSQRNTTLLTAIAFCWGVMCHPLAILAAPILIAHRRLPVVLLCSALGLGPHLLRLWGGAAGALGPDPQFSWGALEAWWDQSGLAAWLFALALGGALTHRTLRSTALATLLGLALMLVTGSQIGYLRDHHLRILSAPAALGLARLPGPLAMVSAVALLRWPERDEGRSRDRRPGTLGLLHRTTNAVLTVRDPDHPIVVDGYRTVHVPAVEPGGVWLDLALRGVDTSALDVRPDSSLLVLVTAPREADAHETPATHGLIRADHRDTWSIWLGNAETVSAWSSADCAERQSNGRPLPRVGGAWDGLALFHPARGAASVDAWWACRHP